MHFSHRSLSVALSLTLILSFAPCVRAGQVVTDGTVGSAGSVPHVGQSFLIGAGLGAQRNGNLFHSFSSFDLDAGETAVFQPPGSGPQVANVIARVTGGSPSTIDGTIDCEIPGANFYLINPNGVVFGPDAQINVQGSFAVTTAANLKFADGVRFSAAKPTNPVLTTAAPVAFGFLGKSFSPITIQGAALIVPAGQALRVVGGGVSISQATLSAPSGRIDIAAVAAAGDVGFRTALRSPLVVNSAGVRADVSLTNHATLTTDGPGSKGIGITARDLVLSHSSITATTAAEPVHFGGGFAFDLSGNLNVSGHSLIVSGGGSETQIFAEDVDLSHHGGIETIEVPGSTEGVPDSIGAGRIRMAIANLSMTSGAFIKRSGFVDAAANPKRPAQKSIDIVASGNVYMDGDAGKGTLIAQNYEFAGSDRDVFIQAGSVDIVNGATITNDFEPNQFGFIRINAGRVTLDGDGFAFVRGEDGEQSLPGTGLVGNVNIRATDLEVLNAAACALSQQGGNGIEDVRAEHIVLDGEGSHLLTGIEGGTLNVTVGGEIDMQDRAGLYAPNAFEDQIETVHLVAGTIRITGTGHLSDLPTGIDTSGGGGTTIQVAARDSLTVSQAGGITGIIEFSSEGGSTGGVVSVTAGRSITLEGHSTTVAASATEDIAAGNIRVSAPRITIIRGASVDSSTAGQAPGGNVVIASNVETFLEGPGSGVFATTTGRPTGPGIRLSPRGGRIKLTGPELVLHNGAEISASSTGSGQAGSIKALVGKLTVKDATIATSSSRGSEAGPIDLVASQDIELFGSRITTQAARNNANGITLSAPDGAIEVANSELLASAGSNGKGNGGNIDFDPSVVVLNSSSINASAGGNGGNLTGQPSATLEVGDVTINLTGKNGVSGTDNLPPPDETIASSVARLPASLESGALTLQPQCGQMLDISTFLIQGRGSVADEPGFWRIDLGTAVASPEAQQSNH